MEEWPLWHILLKQYLDFPVFKVSEAYIDLPFFLTSKNVIKNIENLLPPQSYKMLKIILVVIFQLKTWVR